ncbi:MAG: hypothetical protein AAB468_02650 [Patescibacteria group bacterium]
MKKYLLFAALAIVVATTFGYLPAAAQTTSSTFLQLRSALQRVLSTQVNTAGQIGATIAADTGGSGSYTSTASLPSGSLGQTLYHNGSGWRASSNIYHNGNQVGIGTVQPGGKLEVKGIDGIPAILANGSQAEAIQGQTSGSATAIIGIGNYNLLSGGTADPNGTGVMGISPGGIAVKASVPGNGIGFYQSGNNGINKFDGRLYLMPENVFLVAPPSPAKLIVVGDDQAKDAIMIEKGGISQYSSTANNYFAGDLILGLVGGFVDLPGVPLQAGGGIKLGGSGYRPVCNSSYRGVVWFSVGAGGVSADSFAVCMLDIQGVGSWREL